MLCEVGKSLRNTLKDVWRSRFKFHSHALDLLHDFAPSRVPGQLQIRVFQRTPEAAHSVAVLADVAAFSFIEDVANVFPRIAKMFELRDEMLDRLLEKNIVFPECVVRVNQDRVSGHPAISPVLSRLESNPQRLTATYFSGTDDLLLRRSLSCARRDALQDFASYFLQLAEAGQVVLKLAVQIERSCGVEFRPQDHIPQMDGVRQHGVVAQFV